MNHYEGLVQFVLYCRPINDALGNRPGPGAQTFDSGQASSSNIVIWPHSPYVDVTNIFISTGSQQCRVCQITIPNDKDQLQSTANEFRLFEMSYRVLRTFHVQKLRAQYSVLSSLPCRRHIAMINVCLDCDQPCRLQCHPCLLAHVPICHFHLLVTKQVSFSPRLQQETCPV